MSEKLAVRAPRSGEYFRVNPDPESRSEVDLFRAGDGELYLVVPEVLQKLPTEKRQRVEHCMIFTAQNDDAEMFLWPVVMPIPDDHPAFVAMHEWICLGMH